MAIASGYCSKIALGSATASILLKTSKICPTAIEIGLSKGPIACAYEGITSVNTMRCILAIGCAE